MMEFSSSNPYAPDRIAYQKECMGALRELAYSLSVSGDLKQTMTVVYGITAVLPHALEGIVRQHPLAHQSEEYENWVRVTSEDSAALEFAPQASLEHQATDYADIIQHTSFTLVATADATSIEVASQNLTGYSGIWGLPLVGVGDDLKKACEQLMAETGHFGVGRKQPISCLFGHLPLCPSIDQQPSLATPEQIARQYGPKTADIYNTLGPLGLFNAVMIRSMQTLVASSSSYN